MPLVSAREGKAECVLYPYAFENTDPAAEVSYTPGELTIVPG